MNNEFLHFMKVLWTNLMPDCSHILLCCSSIIGNGWGTHFLYHHPTHVQCWCGTWLKSISQCIPITSLSSQPQVVRNRPYPQQVLFTLLLFTLTVQLRSYSWVLLIILTSLSKIIQTLLLLSSFSIAWAGIKYIPEKRDTTVMYPGKVMHIIGG